MSGLSRRHPHLPVKTDGYFKFVRRFGGATRQRSRRWCLRRRYDPAEMKSCNKKHRNFSETRQRGVLGTSEPEYAGFSRPRGSLRLDFSEITLVFRFRLCCFIVSNYSKNHNDGTGIWFVTAAGRSGWKEALLLRQNWKRRPPTGVLSALFTRSRCYYIQKTLDNVWWLWKSEIGDMVPKKKRTI